MLLLDCEYNGESKMEILVLGGTGAMGEPIVEILANRNNHVIVTTRQDKKSNNKNIEFIQGNAHDLNFVHKVLNRNYDAIVDFMIYKPDEFSAFSKLYMENTKQYVFLSSSRVYANSPENRITESSSRLLDVTNDEQYLATNEYALAKAREENMLMESEFDNFTIIRPYITYNDNRLQLGVFEKEVWLRRALAGKKIVFSRNIASKYTTLTYGYDVALRIADLIGNPKAKRQTYHITTEEYIKWEDVLSIYVDTLEKELGKRPEVFMTEQCDSIIEKNNKYQIHYDREYNRKFSNDKIQSHTMEKKRFMPVKEGLQMCLQNFLDGERNFATPVNWEHEGVLDKISGDKTSLKQITGFKNKVKYVLYRYIM
jgi:nucleoside-diphosphate-sugar epimerase